MREDRMPGFTPLSERVYNHVVDQIEKGELVEGDRILERVLCEALGVSRTPVREALGKLADDGFLVGTPGQGYAVGGFDENDAREVFQTIGPLDGRAAYLAMPNLTEGDLAQLRFLCESMDIAIRNGLTQRYHALQTEFHCYYYNRCGNTRLTRLLHSLEKCLSRRSYENDDASSLANMDKANEEHRHMIELFEQGKAEELEDYIRNVHWALETAKFAVW